MKFIIGGRELSVTAEQVTAAVQDVDPEQIQKHMVEVAGAVFPPKQVLAEVTGWARTSYTTMEAQRVLTKLGFVCRHHGGRTDDHEPRPAPEGWAHQRTTAGSDGPSIDQRLAAAESILATVQAAIVGLHARVAYLESTRS